MEDVIQQVLVAWYRLRLKTINKTTQGSRKLTLFGNVQSPLGPEAKPVEKHLAHTEPIWTGHIDRNHDISTSRLNHSSKLQVSALFLTHSPQKSPFLNSHPSPAPNSWRSNYDLSDGLLEKSPDHHPTHDAGYTPQDNRADFGPISPLPTILGNVPIILVLLKQRFSIQVLAPPRSAYFVCYSYRFRCLFYSIVSALRSGHHRIFRHDSSSKRTYIFHSKWARRELKLYIFTEVYDVTLVCAWRRCAAQIHEWMFQNKVNFNGFACSGSREQWTV